MGDKNPIRTLGDYSKPSHEGYMNTIELPVGNDMISQVSRAEEPPTSFDELMNTLIAFSAFVMNRLNITDLTQELLVGTAFNLLKGTCMSLTEIEYHFEECSKATTERLDSHNPEGKQYSFDLRKPLPLIPISSEDRQVFSPRCYFINNDWEYQKGGDLSRRYSTSITKTKTATYELKWIEDLVPNLWSPIKVAYDKYAYWVTRLNIMKWYDYGHLDEIKVRRDDQQLYTFKEGGRSLIRCRMLPKEAQPHQTRHIQARFHEKNPIHCIFRSSRSDIRGSNQQNCLMHTDELHKFSDGMLNSVQTALHDIHSGIRMDYLPKRKWSGLDKRRARVMIQEIDKQLFQRRLMRNLEKFVGGREYGEDLLLERTI
ncbi:hypothetical protein Tco_0622815 [Tanacetum coccineum]